MHAPALVWMVEPSSSPTAGASSSSCCRTSYFVLVPEVDTDAVVAALRASWLRTLHPSQAHYCVASGTASRDPSLHRLAVHRGSATPTSRDAFFGNGRLLDSTKREVYNSFLRRKVFSIMQAMSRLASRNTLDYAVLLDADTAVNVSNLDKFVQAIPDHGDGIIYTGRCQQAPLPSNPMNATALMLQRLQQRSHRRHDVARYIEMSRLQGSAVKWPGTIPPSPGGGPGLIFSRGLLLKLEAHLSLCSPLTEWNAMGDSIFAGGDSMITRCLALLGVRCATERDMRIDEPTRCPFVHGCALTALFRKNPPWFYQAAGQQKRALRMAHRAQPSEIFGLTSPLHETIAFHHVKPTARIATMDPDPRCAVRMKSDPNARAGWWGSTCLPHFCLIGAPHADTDGLMRMLRGHPEVLAPQLEGRDFFHSGGRVQQLVTWLREKSAVGMPSTHHHVIGSSTWGRLLRSYANRFPSIDPRDFRLTGEAAPTYMYERVAPLFFEHPHFRILRLILVLRNPAERALADLHEMAADSEEHWRRAISMLTTARSVAARCGVTALYAAYGGDSQTPHLQATSGNVSLACDHDASKLSTASAMAWNALWRSWYHLFLPSWMPLRPLVLFSEELRGGTARSELVAFLRLPASPPLNVELATSNTSRVPVTYEASAHMKVAAAILRELLRDTTVLTHELLRKHGVATPDAWQA